ncbi:sensor histidine kinase [Paenibacillus luteus]|uniref:sensor histidine kinase n=1 Tax=Paenibacillus luteus TaxID=2545753 RepID=UPI00114195E6|nr:sensor histidine kinase [Paenibacillus luteus]
MERNREHELSISRAPVLLWVGLVYSATIILQNTLDPRLLQSLLFTLVVALHAILHWNTHILVRNQPWVYFLIQGLLIFVSALLMPVGFPAALIGLFPVLIAQSISIYYRKVKIIYLSLVFYAMFCLAIVSVTEAERLALFIPLFLLMMIVLIAYAVLFYQQVRQRVRTQTFLRDLEIAHMKVEELTLANERQRMARDLHDTLAQGVAGLIMQLEAIGSHLQKGNSGRAEEIVGQSMRHARKTLADAREVIDDLRSEAGSDMKFEEVIQEEVEHFTHATGIRVALTMQIRLTWPKIVVEHSHYIVSECLTNIAKHARAQHVWVTVTDKHEVLIIELRDDGIGFDTDEIGKSAGHYGLIGIRERVRLIGGKVEIVSRTGEGTLIQIYKPVSKGE